MEGLIIDLRNNGGGSLSTVIDIAGLFIEKGPVVQVRGRDGNRNILKDEDPSILYHGPLVILVNELSASASEILAAAMQDYDRAVIIGSKQTYGKGTVQNLLNLNKMMRSNKFGKMGTLKMTTQKFYRINGGSTQLKGVHSDVVVPDRYSYIDIGERDMDNPLPWDQIEKADYDTWKGYSNFEQTMDESQKRMKINKQISLIRESAQWIKKQRSQNVYPLNYNDYANEMTENDSTAKHFDKILDYKTDLTFKSLPDEKRRFVQDTTLEMKRENWHKNLSVDVYVEESIKVLEDLIPEAKSEKVANVKED
jgi:carboxyl-terminal processing protease